MKHRNYKGCELLLAVSNAAQAGDADAVEQILRYHEGYINKLCTRTVCDESGCPHACLDEYMKSCLENKLIRTYSRRELITGPGGRNNLPFPCSFKNSGGQGFYPLTPAVRFDIRTTPSQQSHL